MPEIAWRCVDREFCGDVTTALGNEVGISRDDADRIIHYTGQGDASRSTRLQCYDYEIV